jgi:multiple antibiotic resistance protein
MDAMLGDLLYSTLALFIILDPLLSVPIFVNMTKGKSSQEISREAAIATGVAGVLMFLFLFGNFVIFETLGITIATFQVAGGILLFLLGMQETMGITIGTVRPRESPASVIIGTPLLCGPGTITTVLILSKQFGIPLVALASGISLVATWLVLRYATLIQRLLGETVTDVMGKVLGMLVAAIAVKIIVAGIQTLI